MIFPYEHESIQKVDFPAMISQWPRVVPWGVRCALRCAKKRDGTAPWAPLKSCVSKSYSILAGALKPWKFMTFHSVGNVMIPTGFHIFQRGRSTTNQDCLWNPYVKWIHSWESPKPIWKILEMNRNQKLKRLKSLFWGWRLPLILGKMDILIYFAKTNLIDVTHQKCNCFSKEEGWAHAFSLQIFVGVQRSQPKSAVRS